MPINCAFCRFKYQRRLAAGIAKKEREYTFVNVVLINMKLIHHKLRIYICTAYYGY